MSLESRSPTNNHSTLCATCNQRDGVVYRIQLHTRDDAHLNVEVSLCDRCYNSHKKLEWVTILETVE